MAKGTKTQLTKSKQHQDETTSIQEKSNIVKLLEPLDAVLALVLGLPSGREVAKREQDERQTTGDDAQVVVPAPGLLGVGDKQLSEKCTESSKGKGGKKDASIHERAGAVGNQLGHHKREG